MPKIVKIKRSTVAGSTPTLSYGELGWNSADGKLWAGNAANQAVLVNTAGGGAANIVEVETSGSLPSAGASGSVYIVTDAGKVLRWDTANSVYVEIGTSGGGSSTLPVASSSVLGGIKIGSGLTISDGVVSASGGSDSLLRSLFTPAAPTSVTASAGNAQATVSWTAPTGTISQAPITDYVVQYSSNSGSSWTTFADGTSTATSATVTSLTNGTAYVFRAAAVNALGQGAWSSASSAVTPSAFSASAVILTSGTSYAVPSGASSMKVWAVGPGGQDGGARGHAGAVAHKTWSVSGGQTVSYSIGQRSAYSGSYSRSGSTTVTFSGTTITAEGGGGPNGPDAAATYSGGDGGANGGQGAYVNNKNAGGAVGGNGTLTECGRYPATDVSGLFAAVTMAGGSVVESCGATAAFGSGGSEQAQSLAGIGGGGAWYGVSASDDGGVGAVVIQFS